MRPEGVSIQQILHEANIRCQISGLYYFPRHLYSTGSGHPLPGDTSQ